MKQVKCPLCNKRILDIKQDLKIKIENYKNDGNPDLIQKCPHCKQQLAIFINK